MKKKINLKKNIISTVFLKLKLKVFSPSKIIIIIIIEKLILNLK
jgi:hypothetical protein